ncbi:MAG: inositol monophosphatase [Intrasporangiaceae bacterium]|nr:inositol monophosphatase [Intrasporangiaceae bacterium]
MSTHDAEELRAIAVEVAVETGRIIVEDRPDRLEVATKSTETDVVTEMDQRAQDHIVAVLATRRPQDGFLGEEEGGNRVGESGLTWVVDPIDGTVNYLYGIPAYAVSIAAVTGDPNVPGHWQPVAGAVVNPVTGDVYSAALGRGATRTDRHGRVHRLAATTETDLGQALVATGFGYAGERRAWQAAVVADLIADIRDIRRMGSAALDLCRVAEGSVDAYYERGLNPWDLAAGWLIVTESGGAVSGAKTGTAQGDGTGEGSTAYPSGGGSLLPSADMVVAAGNALHRSFVVRLERAINAVRRPPT